jgi:predicted nucleic acid-binding protein
VSDPAPAIYDPRVGHWTFDTSSLRNLDSGHLAGAVVLNMRGRVHLVPEVVKELPSSSVYRTSPFTWYDVEPILLPREQHLYSLLRLRWKSEPGKDQGEAAAITLAAGHGYGLVCDDGTGVRAATSPEAQVCTMRTTALVVAMARAAWISSGDGWQAIEAMLAAGEWLGRRIPWADRVGFDALCAIATFDVCVGVVQAL